ncbi:MAG: TetR/AcrR family transcriptional regulator, partial [Stellaceae bacterium]
LHSYLEDGVYARELYETVGARVVPLFAASVAAAEAAGDLIATPGAAANHFWFAQHVAAMMAFANLPKDRCVPYEGTAEDFVEEASRFVLRGIGMTAAAIDAAAPPISVAAD